MTGRWPGGTTSPQCTNHTHTHTHTNTLSLPLAISLSLSPVHTPVLPSTMHHNKNLSPMSGGLVRALDHRGPRRTRGVDRRERNLFFFPGVTIGQYVRPCQYVSSCSNVETFEVVYRRLSNRATSHSVQIKLEILNEFSAHIKLERGLILNESGSLHTRPLIFTLYILEVRRWLVTGAIAAHSGSLFFWYVSLIPN